MQRTTIIRTTALALTLTAAPLAFSRKNGVATNDACAQVKIPGTGTCCVQQEAVCVTPTGNLPVRYYKSEGMCP